MPYLGRNDCEKGQEFAGGNMKRLYALHVREFVMLCVSIFIFMVTIHEGTAFHNRKTAHLKTITLKRRTDKWAGASHGDGDPQVKRAIDNENVRPMKDTNGYFITTVLNHKRNLIASLHTGETKPRISNGKVHIIKELHF